MLRLLLLGNIIPVVIRAEQIRRAPVINPITGRQGKMYIRAFLLFHRSETVMS